MATKKKEVNVLWQAKPKPIVLADGKEYLLSPFTMGLLADIEQEFDCSIEEFVSIWEKKKITVILKLACLSLRKHHPDMTLEKIGELITPDNLEQISTELANALNWR